MQHNNMQLKGKILCTPWLKKPTHSTTKPNICFESFKTAFPLLAG